MRESEEHILNPVDHGGGAAKAESSAFGAD
jgi:hypothetical protein